MIRGGVGGASTNQAGLAFEKRTSIRDLLKRMDGYSVKKADIGYSIVYEKDEVACAYPKYDLYRFLESKNIDWTKYISKKLLPDEALYVIAKNTLYIIEIKFQDVAGSVDEKLQTCDFKKKQYKKLFSELNITVEYIYVLNDWFKKKEYKDTLDYIISVGCSYYFHYIPLAILGLPMPSQRRG